MLNIRNVVNVGQSMNNSNDIVVDSEISATSKNPVQNKVIYSELQGKQDTLVSGTNIKTVNNTSLLGSGDITIDSLPSQTGNSGKFLTTDGTDASWATVSLPSNTWTSDNLKAGKNITISEIAKPIIDANTLALWHYDTNFSNSISGSAFTDINSRYTAFSSAGSISTSYHKFGDGSAQGWAQDNYYCVFTSSNNGIGTGDFTVDFWYYLNGSGSWFMLQNVIYSGNMFWCKPLVDGKYEIQQDGGSTISVDNTTGWHHYAIERYQGSVNFYLDGNKVATFTNNSNVDGLTMPFLGTGSTQALDELRISNVARYQGQNFTPFNQPYSTASGESQYAINADLSSKQDILTSATGYDATKTQVLKNVNGTITWVTES